MTCLDVGTGPGEVMIELGSLLEAQAALVQRDRRG
jgi:hypothetical protein